jgi:gas vesicle protein
MARYEFDDDDRVVFIEKQSAGLAPFLLGVAIGAGAALLLAPRSGAATRHDLRRRARRVQRAAEQAVSDVTDRVSDTFEDARRRVEEKIDTARDAIDLKKRQVGRAMDAGRTAAREAREELEQRLAETKAAYHAGAAIAHEDRARIGDEPGGE